MTQIDRADDLYALPLDEFTAARDELARRLRDSGDSEAAKQVKAMRKPSLPAWAVNQLARAEPDDLRRLFDLRDEIANAGGAAELRSLTQERRRVLANLLARAEEVLVAAGHAAAASTTDAISRTLQAGGSDEERARIEAGTLERPLEPSGFEGLAGFEFAEGTAEEPAEPKPSATARRNAERLDDQAREAETEAHDLTVAAEAAAREAAELARRAEKARRRAEKARQKADAALDKLV